MFFLVFPRFRIPEGSSPVTQIPVNNRDTTKTGMVCHRSSISATIPIPIKPVGHLLWVYPYPCWFLFMPKASKWTKVSTPIDGSILGFNMCPDCDNNWLTLKEIQKLVDDDTSMQNLSKIQKQEYLDNLQTYRDTKKTGVRASNQAAALDCWGTVNRMLNKVCTYAPSCQTKLRLF